MTVTTFTEGLCDCRSEGSWGSVLASFLLVIPAASWGVFSEEALELPLFR